MLYCSALTRVTACHLSPVLLTPPLGAGVPLCLPLRNMTPCLMLFPSNINKDEVFSVKAASFKMHTSSTYCPRLLNSKEYSIEIPKSVVFIEVPLWYPSSIARTWRPCAHKEVWCGFILSHKCLELLNNFVLIVLVFSFLTWPFKI